MLNLFHASNNIGTFCVLKKYRKKSTPNSQPAVSLNISENLAFAKTHIASNVQTLANLTPNFSKISR